jgi:hypothetical protein
MGSISVVSKGEELVVGSRGLCVSVDAPEPLRYEIVQRLDNRGYLTCPVHPCLVTVIDCDAVVVVDKDVLARGSGEARADSVAALSLGEHMELAGLAEVPVVAVVPRGRGVPDGAAGSRRHGLAAPREPQRNPDSLICTVSVAYADGNDTSESERVAGLADVVAWVVDGKFSGSRRSFVQVTL